MKTVKNQGIINRNTDIVSLPYRDRQKSGRLHQFLHSSLLREDWGISTDSKVGRIGEACLESWTQCWLLELQDRILPNYFPNCHYEQGLYVKLGVPTGVM